MMRILIAEDELLERKAMKKFIEDNFSDMKVVGEAANGRKAIDLAESTNPDIIFMDIKMPGINGLEAIEQIYRINPLIKFILVSAYDSFEYAKEAMRFGIKDYILKPGKKEEIVSALLRLKNEIEVEARQREEQLQSARLMKENLITKAMQHPVAEDAHELQRKLYPDMKSGCYIVLKSTDAFEQDLFEEQVKKHIDYPYILHIKEDTRIICILASVNLEKADVLRIARKLHHELGQDVYIGAGEIYTTLKKLPKSYQQAYLACLNLMAEKKSNYGFFQENQACENITDILATICKEVEKGHSEQAIFQFNEYEHLFSVKDKEDLYINIKNSLASRNIAITTSSFSSIQSASDWHGYLNMCCMKMRDFFQSRNDLSQVKNYILSHYHESITLEEAADTVKLSANYFSNLFRQEFGMTFIDYVTKVRMEKAKELIEENAHSLKEISFKVGYRDPNYFSRVFKRYYQESPTHFQREIFKK